LCRQQVESTQEAARRDGVTVPKSLAEYCIQSRPELMSVASEEYDFYDDDYNDDDDDEEEEVETDGDEEADDSGNAEL
jgi:hypothetical protein